MQLWVFGIVMLSILALVVSVFLAVYAYTHDRVAGNLSFARLEVVVAVWAGLVVVMYLAPIDSDWVRGVYHARTLVAAAAGVLAIEFIAAYTQSSLLTSRYYRGSLWGLYVAYGWIWLANPGGVAYTVLAVDAYGPLTVVTPALGPASVGYFVCYYTLLAIAFATLVQFSANPSNLYRNQTLLIAGAFLLVILGTLATLLTTPGRRGLDLAILLQGFGGGTIGVAIYKFDFLSVVSPAKKAVVDDIDDPVVVLDTEDRIIYANRAAEALAVTDADTGRSVDSVLEGLTDSLQAGDPYRVGNEGERSVDSGSTKVFDPTESRIENQQGMTCGRAILLRDITAQKRRERLLEQFASSLSHDLRNPLTVAHGKIEVARETGDLSQLEDAAAALERMDELVDQLLDVSHSEKSGLDLQPVRLSSVAEDAWQNISTGESTLSHAGTERSIFASRGHLQQILENLFRNAVEHNETPVTVTVERTEAGFTVADDGTGIPPGDRERVFERGYSGTESGSGLGLDIVAQLAELHGWDVTLTESGTGGAEFVFRT